MSGSKTKMHHIRLFMQLLNIEPTNLIKYRLQFDVEIQQAIQYIINFISQA